GVVDAHLEALFRSFIFALFLCQNDATHASNWLLIAHLNGCSPKCHFRHKTKLWVRLLKTPPALLLRLYLTPHYLKQVYAFAKSERLRHCLRLGLQIQNEYLDWLAGLHLIRAFHVYKAGTR